MRDRVFEDSCNWRVSHGRIEAEVYVYDRPNEGKVMISVEGSDGGEGCNYVIISPEEATLLKEFLIRKGY